MANTADYISMPGVHEYVHHYPVNLIKRENGRWAIQSIHGDCTTSEVDLNDLLVYLAAFSPEAMEDCPVALFLGGRHPRAVRAD